VLGSAMYASHALSAVSIVGRQRTNGADSAGLIESAVWFESVVHDVAPDDWARPGLGPGHCGGRAHGV
jgi:hypothetical protein